ncbi:MAG: TetR/AcrR family transcriptional regulator [Actinomycetota bacterium]|jgi:AcrR family transcriptional regulator|nr:TetR/AcrR family transcriptional regulator [Actinomycetota bacterium]
MSGQGTTQVEGLTRTQRRRQATRAALLDAVVDLLLEQGHGRLSSTDIANQADVAVGTFYNHFLSVEEAIAAAFEHLVPNFAIAAASAMEYDDAAVGFGRAMGLFLRRLGETPRVWQAARVAGWEISPVGDYLMVRGLRQAGVGIASADTEEIRCASVLVCRSLTAMVDSFTNDDVRPELVAQATRILASAVMGDDEAVERAVAAAEERFSEPTGGAGQRDDLAV